MDNPYQSPVGAKGASPQGAETSQRLSPVVRHVRAVAAIMIAHGAVASVAGLVLMALVQLRLTPLVAAPASGSLSQPAELAAGQARLVQWILWGWLAAAMAMVLVGLLQLYAGICNFRFRRRWLGIVALLAGTPLALTGYWAPVVLGIALYGLVIYCHRDVAAAFVMGRQGAAPREILASCWPRGRAP